MVILFRSNSRGCGIGIKILTFFDKLLLLVLQNVAEPYLYHLRCGNNYDNNCNQQGHKIGTSFIWIKYMQTMPWCVRHTLEIGIRGHTTVLELFLTLSSAWPWASGMATPMASSSRTERRRKPMSCRTPSALPTALQRYTCRRARGPLARCLFRWQYFSVRVPYFS